MFFALLSWFSLALYFGLDYFGFVGLYCLVLYCCRGFVLLLGGCLVVWFCLFVLLVFVLYGGFLVCVLIYIYALIVGLLDLVFCFCVTINCACLIGFWFAGVMMVLDCLVWVCVFMVVILLFGWCFWTC